MLASPSIYVQSTAAFMLQQRSWIVEKETIRPTKANVLTVYISTESLLTPVSVAHAHRHTTQRYGNLHLKTKLFGEVNTSSKNEFQVLGTCVYTYICAYVCVFYS